MQEKVGPEAKAEATLRRAAALAETALGRRAPDTAFATGALAAFLKSASRAAPLSAQNDHTPMPLLS